MDPSIVLSGGGTQGHINPLLALLSYFQENYPNIKISFIGTSSGIEQRLIRTKHVSFFSIASTKFRRYSLLRSLLGLFIFPLGVLQSIRHLLFLQPKVLFATGGYVSVPVALAAYLLDIPVIIHEQTTTAGIANRFIGTFANKIAITFEGSSTFFPEEKTLITGNPLRSVLQDKSPNDKYFYFVEKLPTVYITGGSQGAHAINRLVGKTLPDLLEFCNIIHQCGGNSKTKDYEWLLEVKDTLSVQLRKRYYCLPYLDDSRQQEAYTKSDLVLSRAGAGTLNELAQLKIPSVLIPLPPHVNDEQTKNAEYFTKHKAAVMYEQHELEATPEKLTAILKHLLIKNRSLLDVMRKNLDGFVPRDATEAIAKLLVQYCI